MWIAYPLYADTYSGSSKYSGNWAAAQGISSSDQINIWTNSYNVYLGETEYAETFSTSGNEYYARGHQIPDADRQYNQTMVQQTYYAINSTPQIQNGFNGGIWSNLETAVRNLTSFCDTVYVVTGAAFRKKTDGTESITTIVNTRDSKTLPVPNYYWKALLKATWSGGSVTNASAVGFWLPHQDLKGRTTQTTR